ncbi:ABC transporter ATPase [Candidatus Magnetomorum sp. HK-1]|nr:ABC transporter ATPase [Candidatus Magnetomorum sp. HK-1]
MKIFISYAKEDQEIAERLFTDLMSAGVEPWMDIQNLIPGQNWKLMISKAIKESKYFLAILSSNSISKRGYVRKELKMAMEILDELPLSEIFIIPVLIDECKPADEKLSELHWVDLSISYDKGLGQILTVINPAKYDKDKLIHRKEYKYSKQKLIDSDLLSKHVFPVTISEYETIFGRDPSVSICLNSPIISWHHAKLIDKKDGFYLEDLGSTYGTYVNGKKKKSCKIKPDDIISFGGIFFKISEDKKIYKIDIGLDANNITVVFFDKTKKYSKTVLEKISFSIHSPNFVSIMGRSGCGKTTLLLSLCGYIKPTHGTTKISDMSLSKNYNMFRGSIGYVPQDDIVHPELTVYEALYYSAKLRLANDISNKDISFLIDKILTQLELLNIEKNIDIRNVLIGSPSKRGLSGSERKRINMAIELLTDPCILFLDEPTSGLSAVTAYTVMSALRQISSKEKIVIITIHQPNIELYKMMDNTIILSHGKLIYYGPSFPDSLLFFNPDIMLEDIMDNPDNVLKGLIRKTDSEWQLIYKASKYYQKEFYERQCHDSLTKGLNDTNISLLNFRQWWVLVTRCFMIKKKDIISTFFQPFMFSILMVLLLPQKGATEQTNIEPPLLLIVIFSLWFGTYSSIFEIINERTIFMRERMVNLRLFSYIFSKYTVLGFLCLFQCIILLSIIYPFLELRSNFLLLLGVIFLTSLAGLSIGLFLSSIIKTRQAGFALLPLIFLPWVIFSGGVIPISKMGQTAMIISETMPSSWALKLIIDVENNTRNEVEKTKNNPISRVKNEEFLYPLFAIFFNILLFICLTGYTLKKDGG